VSVGEGYITSHEVSTLRRGDVIRTTRLARNPSLVLFNGTLLCPCEVVVRDQWLGFRIVDGECQGRGAADPGVMDGPMELLPSTVSLGSIRMSLAELQEMHSTALKGLGKSWSMEEDAELLVAGIPTAHGKVVAIGEEVGMRVTEAAGATFRTRAVHPSGFLLEAGSAAARATDYDFREPYGLVSPIVRMNTALMCDHGGPPPEFPTPHLDSGPAVLVETARVLQAILVHGILAMPYAPRGEGSVRRVRA
jgi:flagellar motor switch/type III secretory pathway protein FliN